MTPVALSIQVASVSTLIAVVVGLGLAALLARRENIFANLLDASINLPLVLPPTVLGYYLLVALGVRSPLGAWLEARGLALVFTWQGAVVAASIVALPLFVQSAKAAIEAVDEDLHDVARTLGRSEFSIFRSVTLPLAWRGVLAGALLAFARALGEFGATLMVAGNIPGRTQTLPLSIYDSAQAGDIQRANAQALLLTVVGIGVLFALRYVGRAVAGSEANA